MLREPVLLVLLCAACGGGAGDSRAQAPAGGGPPGSELAPPRDVKIAKASEIVWERTVRAVGSLEPFEQATLSAKVPGRLVALAIDLGSCVRRGDVVARIDPTDYRLRVRQSEAALAQARARLGLPMEGDDDRVDPEKAALVREARAALDGAKSKVERWRPLRGTGAASDDAIDAAEAEFRGAEGRLQDALEEVENRRAQLVQRRADLEVARQALADTDIVAPFDGLSLGRKAGLGDFLAAGAPVSALVRVDPLRLRVEVPEKDALLVKTGQAVRLSLEGDSRTWTGVVARIGPVIHESSRSLVVEAEIRNPGWAGADDGERAAPPDGGRAGPSDDSPLRPGAFARVEIVVDPAARTLSAPAAALVSFAGVDKIFAAKEGQAVEHRVAVGRRTKESVEILSGLEAGEWVVLQPGNLQGGQPIRHEKPID